MTENGAQGPTPGVRFIEVSVKRELTVLTMYVASENQPLYLMDF